jgi:hypothetical protein
MDTDGAVLAMDAGQWESLVIHGTDKPRNCRPAPIGGLGHTSSWPLQEDATAAVDARRRGGYR